MIAGKDRGKTGVVSRAFPKEGRVIVEGVNKKKKHQKAGSKEKKGQIIEKEYPIDASNVMVADPKTGKPTRVTVAREGEKRVRIAKKSGQHI